MGMNHRKLLKKILASPANVRFDDFCKLVEAFGFELVRISGNHPIFSHHRLGISVNLQEWQGEAKPCQVRDFLKLVESQGLTI